MQLDPKVQMLIDACGVKVISFNEGYLLGMLTPGEMSLDTLGLYDGVTDTIFVNLDAALIDERIMTRIVLHELSHATGHSKRLGRPCIVSTETSNDLRSFEQYHTEEATADLGMYKLARQLGFDAAYFAYMANSYVKLFRFADIRKADRESDEIVNYLMGMLEIEKAA